MSELIPLLDHHFSWAAAAPSPPRAVSTPRGRLTALATRCWVYIRRLPNPEEVGTAEET